MRAMHLFGLLGLCASPALAAGDPDAVKGLLVERCADCHAIPGYSEGAPATGVDAPPFAVIANDAQSYTEEGVRAFLEKPHWPMGGFILSPSDIDDIMAYLATLRRQ